MSKEKKVCSLTLNEWVNYLMQEQNTERLDFYNESLSILTIMILLLTLLSIVLAVMSFTYTFISIDAVTIRIIISVALGMIFIIIAVVVYAIFIKLPKSKTDMKRITKSEANLIDDILRGNEVNSECILKRYSDIGRNK